MPPKPWIKKLKLGCRVAHIDALATLCWVYIVYSNASTGASTLSMSAEVAINFYNDIWFECIA